MAYDIYEGKTTRIEFEGGVRVEGEVITGKRNLQGKIVLISFQNCTVTYGDEILFAPEWGVYDMAVGKKVISAFSGPADPSSFDLITHIPSEKTIQKQKSEKRLVLESLYQQCRDLRETGNRQDVLETIFDQLKENHPEDWLLALELYELSEDGSTLQKSLGACLARQMESIPGMAHLIENGMHLIKSQHAARA